MSTVNYLIPKTKRPIWLPDLEALDILAADLTIAQRDLVFDKASFWHTPQIHDHFQQIMAPIGLT